MYDACKALDLSITIEQVSVHHVETRIKPDKIHFSAKRLAHIRNACLEHLSRLVVHIAETLSIVECEFEMLSVSSRLQPCRISENYFHIVIAPLRTIDDNPIQQSRLGILALYKQTISRYVVVEHSLGNLQLRRFLPHAPHERSKLPHSHRLHIVLKIETASTDHTYKNEYRCQNACQGHPRSFHCQQFKLLSHITETYERCQQYSQRDGHRNQSEASIKEELSDDIPAEPLPDKVIDMLEEKLHHKDKQAYKERRCE